MSDELTWDPGWFPDPTGRHDHRWWDGVTWTAHVADAGIAGHDPLEAQDARRADTPVDTSGASDAVAASAARSGTDPVAITSLAVAVPAVPLALLPALGLVPALTGLILAVVARARLRRSGRSGGGLAMAALVTSLVALLIAALVTIITVSVLGGSGGELAEAFRQYATCLEVDTPAECRVLLEQSLARMMG